MDNGIIAINKDSIVIVFNEAACTILGYTYLDIIGKHCDVLFGNESVDSTIITRSLTTGDVYPNISLNINCSDNKKINVNASITPILQPSQGNIGIIIVFQDLGENKNLHSALYTKDRELIEEKNKLETIFNSLLEGTFTINTDLEITSFNLAAEGITGYTVAEAIGKKYWEVLPSIDIDEDPQLKAFITEHHQALLREITIIRKDGRRVLVRINSAPLTDVTGNKTGRVVTFEDISILKNLSDHIEERFNFENIIGRSKPLLRVFELMKNVINTDSTVLITGESGTGKEVIARAIHLNSERKSEPFIAVNCTAFAESLLESELFGHEKGAFTGAVRTKPGRFELAGNGTIFLDEIGDITLPIQVKLLRVLENRQFERVGGTKTINMNARIISATHKDLEKEIQNGNFREDLYYRINVVNIHLPSLYERKDDIPGLINHFINKFSKKFKKDIHYISPGALKIIMHYTWPGNIRELENAIEHAFVVCNGDAIKTEHLPAKLKVLKDKLDTTNNNNANGITPLEEAESQLIKDILLKFKGNKKKTAEELGVNKTTLWRKMKKYRL